MQVCHRRLGPERRQVDGLQRCVGSLQRLCLPRGQSGLHLCLHGRRRGWCLTPRRFRTGPRWGQTAGGGVDTADAGDVCRLDAGIQLQLGSRSGQRALQRGMGAQLQVCAAAGYGGAHGAVYRGVQRHRCLRIQGHPRRVAPLRECQLVNVQAVLLSVKPVVAPQVLGQYRRWPLPFDGVDLERHANLQRQHELGEGL